MQTIIDISEAEEINRIKYMVCCPMCDNEKCVRNTDKCEAEIWAKNKIKRQVKPNKVLDNKLISNAMEEDRCRFCGGVKRFGICQDCGSDM